LQICGGSYERVGRYAVSFTEYDDVTTNHVASGDMLCDTIADDDRFWGRQISKRLEDTFSAELLDDCDRNGEQSEDNEDEGITQLAKHQVDEAADDQQDEHRLAQNVSNDAEFASAVGLWEGVWSIGLQAGAYLL
jgi:hypothetical protein